MTVNNNNPNDSIWNLRSSDYQKPLPDSAGHGWTSRLTSSDASG